MNLSKLVRGKVQEMRAYGSLRHGDTPLSILLDANESPYEDRYNRYPDPNQSRLRAKLADIEQVSPDQLIFGNGSDELIDIIIRTFCDAGRDKVRYLTPTFGMYAVSTDIHGASKDPISLDDQFDIDVDKTLANQTSESKLLLLCSPNNPTGNLMSQDRMETVIKGWRGIVVVDEAYIQFVDRLSFSKRLAEFSNVIVLQTFSKAYGAAGLRVGVGYARKEIISYLNVVKPPFNVCTPSIDEALRVLDQRDQYRARLDELNAECARVAFTLEGVNGIDKVYASDANFILVKCQKHQELYQYLYQEHQLLVRDISGSPRCQSCLRISIGLSHENEKLISAIQQFYNV